MRKIEFRGKRVDNGEWVYGFVFICDGRAYLKSGENHSRFGIGVEVTPETVGQFTGLLDKNGKEIYEGDQIQCFISGKKDGVIDQVEFHDGCFDFRYRGIPITYWLNDDRETEIIGNIFDNPELLAD